MAETFQPVFPGSDTSPTPAPASGQAAPFEPLAPQAAQATPSDSLPGSETPGTSAAQATGDAALPQDDSPATPAANPPHAHEPSIRLHREGDRITRIEVQCRCGATMQLDCQY